MFWGPFEDLPEGIQQAILAAMLQQEDSLYPDPTYYDPTWSDFDEW